MKHTSNSTDLRTPDLLKPFKEYKREAVMHIESAYLVNALRQANGSVANAAKAAKILRPAFSRLLRRNKLKSKDLKK